ncbi:MAG: DUF402 domain-containing protein [Clostridia bacterium]|nr:DUF402 domain-containing protein [Clostridia bacterium]
MELEKKYMNKKNWSRVLESEFVFCKLDENNIKGIASLTLIKKVKAPLIKKYKDNLELKIADNDYYWLQLGIESENYWITAMYDSNKKLIQYYIDITDKNIINDSESYFIDLFLDIVIVKNEEVMILDEDELELALKNRVITIEQYELAYMKTKEFIKDLSKKKNEIDTICNKYFDVLVKKI